MSQEYDVDPNAIMSALDQGQAQFEPTLAQLDEWSKNTIMQLLYIWEPVENEETGKTELRPTSIRYPDLHNAAGYALSHLNMVMNYSHDKARAILLGWHGGYYTPLWYKYRRDYDAITILRTLDVVITRNIMGGSTKGTHQTFIETLMGAVKTLNIGNRRE